MFTTMAIPPTLPILTNRSKGPSVRYLQRLINLRLQDLGMISTISVLVDGVFGPETTMAVKYLQCVSGLPVNGKVKQTTWLFIAGGPSGLPMLSIGDNSTQVLAVQQTVLNAGISVLPDGCFGEETAIALKAYQHQKGLVVDGVVGPQTWNKVVRSRLQDLPCAALL
ncbi:MAG: peptidoglycan-binding protein, partial [Cyanobacteria bacterium J06643_4]